MSFINIEIIIDKIPIHSFAVKIKLIYVHKKGGDVANLVSDLGRILKKYV